MELVTRATRGRQPEPHARKADKPATYPKGRVCSERGCQTVLNQYHKGPKCHACAPSPRHVLIDSVGELQELMAA